MPTKKASPQITGSRQLTVRLDHQTYDLLDKNAGRAKSQYIDAVVNDALKRGVLVTVGGTLVQPEAGDLFAGKGRKR